MHFHYVIQYQSVYPTNKRYSKKLNWRLTFTLHQLYSNVMKQLTHLINTTYN